MSRSAVQRQAADGDRISRLPVEILDLIVGHLPIQEAAQTAVLSTIWRDVWSSLSVLFFDSHFFSNFDRRYRQASSYAWRSSCLHPIDKFLLQHKGSIRKFVCIHSAADIVWCPSFKTWIRWLLLVTQLGVEEIYLCFGRIEYKLPDCIFSCSTLRTLHLEGFSIEPLNSPCALPNLTSLHFEYVHFGHTNITNYALDAPKLESVSFINCQDMFLFNISARNVCSLTISWCSSSKAYKFLPVNLDLGSICTLEMNDYAAEFFTYQYYSNTKGDSLQLPVLNVQSLKQSGIYFQNDPRTFAFVSMLQSCPKLRNLEISFEEELEDTTKWMDATSKLMKRFRSVIESHKMLLCLKLRDFKGSRSQMQFIKEMLARLPALEKVVIIGDYYASDDNKKHKIMKEILHFPRASANAIIVYR